jgi:hypothetical protein
MVDPGQIIPKHKFDFDAVENLKKFRVDEITQYIPGILEWLQDGNWPVFSALGNYLEPHFNKIQHEIVDVLKTDDDIWKYWIILLIKNCGYMPGLIIMNELNRIITSPTKGEIEEGVLEIALEIANNQ